MAKKNFSQPDDLVSGLDDRAPAAPRGARGRGKVFTERARKAHLLQRWDISGLLFRPVGRQL